ncbi:hypothetical protein [Microcoleus sp. S28C3]|uniref:hypothetical protein n=1 Tax=Microcoleus sp. S28C3 TaxID=3055414 RepID=UPI00403F3DE0
MNAQIRIQQPMQKASQMKVENLDHLGLVVGLIDEIGIVQKINEVVNGLIFDVLWVKKI